MLQQVSNIHELGLVTCSLDSTIKITDLSRCKVLHTVTAHRRGVHCFAHSKAFSLCASGGLERDILLWQGSTNRQVGEMTGHAASICHIAIDNRRCQVCSTQHACCHVLKRIHNKAVYSLPKRDQHIRGMLELCIVFLHMRIDSSMCEESAVMKRQLLAAPGCCSVLP